jgi:hypothetical protein
LPSLVAFIALGVILIGMAIYQTKTFARWAKKVGLQDAELYVAAQEVTTGQVEASLGGNIYKKRVALCGGGKCGEGLAFHSRSWIKICLESRRNQRGKAR